MKIIDDEYIDKTSRQYAIHSLGLIGDDEAFPLLMKTYEDPDPYIRSYALDAISKYKKNESERFFFRALKDDSCRSVSRLLFLHLNIKMKNLSSSYL